MMQQGNRVEKLYNKSGRISKVIAGKDVTSYSYYDNGSLKNVVYNNNFKEAYTYYSNNQLNTLKNINPEGSVIDRYTYTYDAAGNRIKEVITKGSHITENKYLYNNQNRLTSIVSKADNVTASTITYTYDGNGNQLTASTRTYTDGSETSDVTLQSNTYDAKNQLVKTITDNGTIIKYTYNGEGYRIKKEVGENKTYYLYNNDKVILEVGADGNQKACNVYGNNLIKRTAEEAYYYLYNGHADVTALVKNDGTVAATYYYDAFGIIKQNIGEANNSIKYSGYQHDDETGMYYLNSRMYDPQIARFMQEDTASGDENDPLSLNLYTYCVNNPIKYTDPNGHMPVINLRATSEFYNMGIVDKYVVSGYTILQNGLGFYTGLHEIAQLNIAKELANKGYDLTLEYKITSKTEKNRWGGKKKYEADVVSGNQVWEVKPSGTSGLAQLGKYTENDTSLTPGYILKIQ